MRWEKKGELWNLYASSSMFYKDEALIASMKNDGSDTEYVWSCMNFREGTKEPDFPNRESARGFISAPTLEGAKEVVETSIREELEEIIWDLNELKEQFTCWSFSN